MGSSSTAGSLSLGQAPRYLLRDRDGSYGATFHEAARWLETWEILTTPQSPWRNAYVDRLIGSIRRECLDHVVVLNESGLRRNLKSYFDCYNRSGLHRLNRSHLLARGTPNICGRDEVDSAVTWVTRVSDLHHRPV